MTKAKYPRFHHDAIGDTADEFIFRKNGSNGPDIYIGSNGNNVYNGRNGNDTLHGGWGNDRLSGGNGFDYVMGEGGNDRLSGGPGNDTISGDIGRDRMSGGSGLDTFLYVANGGVMPGGHGRDVITDFDPRGRDGDVIEILINYAFNVSTFAQLKAGMQQVNGDTIMNFDNIDILILKDVRISELHADNFFIFGG